MYSSFPHLTFLNSHHTTSMTVVFPLVLLFPCCSAYWSVCLCLWLNSKPHTTWYRGTQYAVCTVLYYTLLFIIVWSMKLLNCQFILQYARPGVAGSQFWKVEVSSRMANRKTPLLCHHYALKKEKIKMKHDLELVLPVFPLLQQCSVIVVILTSIKLGAFS